MRHLLLGAGGILGSAVGTVLSRQGADVHLLRPRWGSPSTVPGTILEAIPRLVAPESATTVVWAAGVGHVGASADSLAAETSGLSALADALRRLPADRAAQMTVVFASSAGAIFGGHGSSEICEDTPPRPLTAYGEQKLAQERLLRQAAEQTGCRVVACRISNLYGLAQGRLRRRGLVSTAVSCTRLRQPMIIYVSPDTRRDYLYNHDAARLVLEAGTDAGPGFATLLVRDGRTRTVAEVLGVVGQVARRRVPATYAERPETTLQPRVLRFVPAAAGASRVRLTPMPAAIHLMARAPIAS